jgi:DNA-binding SARP family transcriptional activator
MDALQLGVLGPLQISVAGRLVELRRAKQRSLLALLLLNVGEVVSTDRLVEELWAGRPPKTAVGSLQNLVSELRKVLGPDVLRTRAPGYVLDVDPELVDLRRFLRLVAQAGEVKDPELRAARLREALALWRGPPLADLALEPFAQVEIARLEELRTAAREELIYAELEVGRHSQLVGELEALVAEHPLRERLRGQLMLALYRSGRQAEALEAYREARETLVGQLGIEPSPELQRLEQAILRHDQALELSSGPKVAAPPTEPESPDRRKTVSVLFTDIVDSTSLGAQLDPEIVRSVMRRYYDTVSTIIERHGGSLEKFIGDAAMAVFGIPQLHEDDALRAVRAAGELREALAGLNEALSREHQLTIQIRTAINTGEVIASDAASGQQFAAGGAVNVAMRLQQSALPGETLLGVNTERLVRDAVTTEPVDPVELGGSLGRVQAFRLVELADQAVLQRAPRAPLIGRMAELATLRKAFERVGTERRSHLLTVLGEAGIGKTRLANELVSSLGAEATALFGRCVSYGEGATYLPMTEIVRQAVPQRPRATIASLLAGDADADLVAQRVTELTGESEGTASTGEAFWAVRRLFEGLARRRPLLVVLEDIHWAEPTLLELIEYLGTWISEAPVLMLCLARPELLEKRPGWGAQAETIVLDPLSEDEAHMLVGELAGAIGVSDEVRSRIVEAAEGNALFVEQLHAYVTEDVGPEELESVPPSIEALLASRLDRLEPSERTLLERAAIVGKDFRRAAVLHLSPPEELVGLDDAFRSLERKGLVHAARPTGLDEETLRFHHVLIRDVAYAGVTKELRAALHERHAAWLDQRSESDELIGYHVEQAHHYLAELRPADAAVKRLAVWAGERLGAAGIRAWKRADTSATVNLLGRAVELLPAESHDRAELLCELGIAQRWLGELEPARETLAEAIEASAATRDRRVEFRSRIELAYAHVFGESEQTADELLTLAEQAIPTFEELGDDLALGRTWRHVGYVRGGIQGRLADWQEAAERALTHYRRSGWSASGCLAELAAALFYGPAPVPDGVKRCEELLLEATDRAGRANVLAFLAGLKALGGDLDEARHLIGEAAATYEEIGEVYALANNSGRVLSRIELLAGDPAAAERVLRQGCETFDRVHDRAGLSTLSAELADTLYVQARYEEAESWVELAERSAPRDDLSAQWGLRRVRAKLLARRDSHDQAETLANEAASLAGGSDALNDSAVVMLDVAEVLRLAGRTGDAAAFVEQARDLFELKGNVVSAAQARNLLDELALA